MSVRTELFIGSGGIAPACAALEAAGADYTRLDGRGVWTAPDGVVWREGAAVIVLIDAAASAKDAAISAAHAAGEQAILVVESECRARIA
jgi:hypothetical protein